MCPLFSHKIEKIHKPSLVSINIQAKPVCWVLQHPTQIKSGSRSWGPCYHIRVFPDKVIKFIWVIFDVCFLNIPEK